MANRDGKLILRTLKNISAAVEVEGGGGTEVVTELPEVGKPNTIYELHQNVEPTYNWVAEINDLIEQGGEKVSYWIYANNVWTNTEDIGKFNTITIPITVCGSGKFDRPSIETTIITGDDGNNYIPEMQWEDANNSHGYAIWLLSVSKDVKALTFSPIVAVDWNFGTATTPYYQNGSDDTEFLVDISIVDGLSMNVHENK